MSSPCSAHCLLRRECFHPLRLARHSITNSLSVSQKLPLSIFVPRSTRVSIPATCSTSPRTRPIHPFPLLLCDAFDPIFVAYLTYMSIRNVKFIQTIFPDSITKPRTPPSRTFSSLRLDISFSTRLTPPRSLSSTKKNSSIGISPISINSDIIVCYLLFIFIHYTSKTTKRLPEIPIIIRSNALAAPQEPSSLLIIRGKTKSPAFLSALSGIDVFKTRLLSDVNIGHSLSIPPTKLINSTSSSANKMGLRISKQSFENKTSEESIIELDLTNGPDVKIIPCTSVSIGIFIPIMKYFFMIYNIIMFIRGSHGFRRIHPSNLRNAPLQSEMILEGYGKLIRSSVDFPQRNPSATRLLIKSGRDVYQSNPWIFSRHPRLVIGLLSDTSPSSNFPSPLNVIGKAEKANFAKDPPTPIINTEISSRFENSDSKKAETVKKPVARKVDFFKNEQSRFKRIMPQPYLQNGSSNHLLQAALDDVCTSKSYFLMGPGDTFFSTCSGSDSESDSEEEYEEDSSNGLHRAGSGAYVPPHRRNVEPGVSIKRYSTAPQILKDKSTESGNIVSSNPSSSTSTFNKERTWSHLGNILIQSSQIMSHSEPGSSASHARKQASLNISESKMGQSSKTASNEIQLPIFKWDLPKCNASVASSSNRVTPLNDGKQRVKKNSSTSKRRILSKEEALKAKKLFEEEIMRTVMNDTASYRQSTGGPPAYVSKLPRVSKVNTGQEISSEPSVVRRPAETTVKRQKYSSITVTGNHPLPGASVSERQKRFGGFGVERSSEETVENGRMRGGIILTGNQPLPGASVSDRKKRFGRSGVVTNTTSGRFNSRTDGTQLRESSKPGSFSRAGQHNRRDEQVGNRWPKCLNVNCKGFHLLRDCPITSTFERRNIYDEYYAKRKLDKNEQRSSDRPSWRN